MSFRAPIGISDFRQLRDSGAGYVDKTRFVLDVLEASAQVMLFPRPRRFGKTLNLSTLRYFLEKSPEDRSRLFEGLEVWGTDVVSRNFQQYPVIYLTFKDIKAATFEMTFEAIKLEIQRLFGEHRYLLDDRTLNEEDRRRFREVLDGEDNEPLYWSALKDLSALLARHHGRPVVVLIDEYDTPIITGYHQGFYEPAIRFFRNFFSGGLKDNPHLFKGVLTGILRVARESLFSGLNNLAVYSLLATRFNTAFGFTEPEVTRLTGLAGESGQLEALRTWYNGYLFGGEVIYNPWSVLNFIDQADGVFRPYWVSTGSDDLIRELLIDRGLGLSRDMESLLAGESIVKRLDENIVLRDVAQQRDVVWSFLVFTGYLKVIEHGYEDADLVGRLAIPNLEVRLTYKEIFRGWILRGLGGGEKVRALLEALLSGSLEDFEELLGDLLLASFSYHDLGPAATEALYHAFILGLLVSLEGRYEVRSNRESGYGRFDVMIRPLQPGLPGVVLELKVRNVKRRETVPQALKAALKQLEERDYAAALREAGATPVRELAVVFDGRRAWVRALER